MIEGIWLKDEKEEKKEKESKDYEGVGILPRLVTYDKKTEKFS